MTNEGFSIKDFWNKIKKFSQIEKDDLDIEIKRIIENPTAGEGKKGDLRGVYVHKFKIKTMQYLLSCRMLNDDGIELIMIGPHENYYRDLKSYLKSKG